MPAVRTHIHPVRRVTFLFLLLLGFLAAFWVGRSAAPRPPVPAADQGALPETTATAAAVAVLKDSLRSARDRLLRAIAERDTYLPVMLAEVSSVALEKALQ